MIGIVNVYKEIRKCDESKFSTLTRLCSFSMFIIILTLSTTQNDFIIQTLHPLFSLSHAAITAELPKLDPSSQSKAVRTFYNRNCGHTNYYLCRTKVKYIKEKNR